WCGQEHRTCTTLRDAWQQHEVEGHGTRVAPLPHAGRHLARTPGEGARRLVPDERRVARTHEPHVLRDGGGHHGSCDGIEGIGEGKRHSVRRLLVGDRVRGPALHARTRGYRDLGSDLYGTDDDAAHGFRNLRLPYEPSGYRYRRHDMRLADAAQFG